MPACCPRPWVWMPPLSLAQDPQAEPQAEPQAALPSTRAPGDPTHVRVGPERCGEASPCPGPRTGRQALAVPWAMALGGTGTLLCPHSGLGVSYK